MTQGRAKLCDHTLMCHVLAHPPGYLHLNNLLPFGDQGALSRVAEIKVNEEKYICVTWGQLPLLPQLCVHSTRTVAGRLSLRTLGTQHCPACSCLGRSKSCNCHVLKGPARGEEEQDPQEDDCCLPLLTTGKQYQGLQFCGKRESKLQLQLTSPFAEENCKHANV